MNPDHDIMLLRDRGHLLNEISVILPHFLSLSGIPKILDAPGTAGSSVEDELESLESSSDWEKLSSLMNRRDDLYNQLETCHSKLEKLLGDKR